mgnify:CR=1 FL=1
MPRACPSRTDPERSDDAPLVLPVAMRTARDATLSAPQLILPSLQVNIRAGALPPPSARGHTYLRLPVGAL